MILGRQNIDVRRTDGGHGRQTKAFDSHLSLPPNIPLLLPRLDAPHLHFFLPSALLLALPRCLPTFLVHLRMLVHVVSPCKPPPTPRIGTQKTLQATVCSLVRPQVRNPGELPPAVHPGAGVGSLACVDPDVDFQVGFPREGFFADGAGEGTDAPVCEEVSFQISLKGECFLAVVAGKRAIGEDGAVSFQIVVLGV